MIATSSIEGLTAAIQLIGYLLSLCILTTIALFIYVAIATFKLHRQDAGEKSSRTSPESSRARSCHSPHPARPGAHLPDYGSPAGAKRSRR